MGRELRIGFAMGGGTSLGTFNGAALSEALKLAILFGRYKVKENGQEVTRPYDKVVVDVISGASAGAMSLGIMLRSLLHQTPEQIAKAEVKLAQQYGEAAAEFKNKNANGYRDLIAAQVVQDSQETIWCEEIGLDRMLGKEAPIRRSLKHAGSVFAREAVDDIAARWLALDGVELEPRVLGQRVLYACTLSNVSPMQASSVGEIKAPEEATLGFRDGLVSKVHRDTRVFDLYLTTIDPDQFDKHHDHPERWMRYHTGKKKSGRVGSLTETTNGWATIAATAIASGAFPFAFEPVVLMRRKYELGALWPESFTFDPEVGPKFDKYPFTYIDGGAFNNEPIREAFRLASFLDAQPANPDNTPRNSDFDRRIIFVDPNVDAKRDSYRVPIHGQFKLEDTDLVGQLEGHTQVRPASADRLLSHLGSVATAIMNESRGAEDDKIFEVRRRFEMRTKLREIASGLALADASEGSMTALFEYCAEHLKRQGGMADIPSAGTSLRSELSRVILEEDRLWKLAGSDDANMVAVRAAVDDFLSRKDKGTLSKYADPKIAKLWMLALSYVAFDVTMGLTSKWRDSLLIAVFPAKLRTTPNGKLAADPIELPGGAIAGFAGFMSKVNRQYECRMARSCAREFLMHAGLLRKDDIAQLPSIDVQWGEADKSEFLRNVASGTALLGQRLKDMVADAESLKVLVGVDQLIQRYMNRKVDRLVGRLTTTTPEFLRFEFRIEVPDKNLELDGTGSGLNDIGAIRLDELNTWWLIAQADWYPATSEWKGPHVHREGQRFFFHVDSDSLIENDHSFCQIELPGSSIPGWGDLLPNPTFAAQLTANDKGRKLPVERWDKAYIGSDLLSIDRKWKGGDAGFGVIPLEYTLFRKE